MLNLKESPLIAMEVTLKNYEKLSPKMAIEKIRFLKTTVKKYKGNFVFLWHNSSLFTQEWDSYIPVFNEIYKK